MALHVAVSAVFEETKQQQPALHIVTVKHCQCMVSVIGSQSIQLRVI